MLKADNFERGIVAARPGQMYAWPGLVRLQGDEVLAIASERKHHVCPYGRVVIMRSLDGGRTWSLPQEIFNSELDDRDGTLVVMPDGVIIASWFTSAAWTINEYCRPEWYSRRERLSDKTVKELTGDWLIRSTDGGHTWENETCRLPKSGACHCGPFVLSDGRLITFGYETISDEVEMCAFTSADKGESWSRIAVVPSEKAMPDGESNGVDLPTSIMNERAFLEIAPNHYLALFRTHTFTMLQTESTDAGMIWSKPREVPFGGLPANLIRLSSGAILCSYGHRAEPWSVRAVLSYDNGRTWDTDNIITLDQWEDKPDMGYPMAVEVAPGQILTIYYASRAPICHELELEKGYKRGATPEGILYVRYTLK